MNGISASFKARTIVVRKDTRLTGGQPGNVASVPPTNRWRLYGSTQEFGQGSPGSVSHAPIHSGRWRPAFALQDPYAPAPPVEHSSPRPTYRCLGYSSSLVYLDASAAQAPRHHVITHLPPAPGHSNALSFTCGARSALTGATPRYE